MGKKHSNRFAQLVAGFAASAFALLVTATVQYQSAEVQMAQIMGKSSAEAQAYEYRHMSLCTDNIRESKMRTITRICELLESLQ